MKLKNTLILLSLLTTANAHSLDVQGHRGARSVLPENSLAAFEYALQIGVDTLELDTGISKDGVVVIYHDQTINQQLCRYDDGKKVENELWIHQLTFAELQKFDCGSQINPRFKKQKLIPGTNIPSLRTLFEMVQQSNLPNASTIQFNIETKSDPSKPHAQPSPDVFSKAVLQLASEFDFLPRVTLQSFDHRTLLAAREHFPEVQTAALFADNLSDWVTPTKAAGANIVSPNFKNISAREVRAIHAAGLKVIPWTANKPSQWKKLIDMKVDGIITDDPLPLLQLLGRSTTQATTQQ